MPSPRRGLEGELGSSDPLDVASPRIMLCVRSPQELPEQQVVVLGGYGAVGRHVVAALAAEPAVAQVVVAGRSIARAERVAAAHPGRARAATVELADEHAVARVLKDAAVVVACVPDDDGGSARAALARGVHFVDLSALADEELTSRSAFAQGLLTNVLNPKAVLFFAAVLPQFLASGPVPVWVQVVALGVLDIALGFAAWAVVVALGVRLAGVMRRPRVRQWWDRVTGASLGGIGGGLILTR